jgi:hypothetical protein
MLAVALRSIVSLGMALLLLTILLPAGSAWLGLEPEQTREIPGRTLQPIVGHGVAQDDGLLITGYQKQADEYHAVAVWRGDLQAQAFALLKYKISAQPPDVLLYLTWQRKDGSSTVVSTPLNSNTPGPSVFVLSKHPEWRGTITALGVYVVAQRPDQSLIIDGLVLDSGDATSSLEAPWSGWLEFRGWTQLSINLLRGTTNDSALSPVPVAAAWVALACLLLLVFGMARGRHLPGTFLVVLLVPWIALDLLWQVELQSQLVQSRAQFGGKTAHQKHLADDDAAIYRYITRLKNSVLPTQPVRLVIAHDSRGHNYARLKAQYYLLPHNVFNFGSGPPLHGYGKGDYILVLGKTGSPAYQRDRGKLIWNHGMEVRVELVDSDPMGDLYRLTRRPKGGRES